MTYHSLRFKILFVLINIFLSHTLTSQTNTYRDSIIAELSNFKSQDSIRIKKLINTSYEIINNDPSLSLELAEKAHKISKSIKWEKGIALALRQKGVTYYRISDNLNALASFQSALKLNFTDANTVFKASLNNNIGNIYADLKQYDSALKSYETLLEAAIEENSTEDQIRALVNIANVKTETGDSDDAILKLEEALIFSKKIKNDYFIGAITNNLGIAYKKKEAYKKAQYYYQEAYNYGKKINNKYLEATAVNSLSKIELIFENYDKAILYAKESLEISTDIDAIEWQSDSWELLHKAYEELQLNDKALEAYKNHIILKDSIKGQEITTEIIKKEAEFKAETQKAITKSKQEKQALINKLLIIGIIAFIFVSVIIFIFYRRKQKAISITKEAQFKARVSELELKALKAQMNPHFLFNALTSIGKYILKNDTESANDYLTKYASLVRQTLESSNEELISLESEIVLLKTYLEIEKKRLQNKFNYTINIKDQIDTDITLVPPLILQPFIENSIIHGISSMEKSGHITLEFSKIDNKLICIIEDNGIGRKASKDKSQENKESLGIKITKNRINLMNKKTQNNIKIIDKDIGTRVEVTLPLKLDL